MDRTLIKSLCAALLVASLVASPRARAADSETSRVVAAANAFLATLDDKQRASVLFAFDDQKQRVHWTMLPIASVPRAGVSVGEMNDAQRTGVMALLSASLSPKGFEKIQQIMEGDEVLNVNEGKKRKIGKAYYYISFVGTPSEQQPWMLQFTGHHLSLNITFVGEKGVYTPSITAIQPATYESNGKTVRALGNEIDKAFALLHALDESQRKSAVLNYKVPDLVLGPGQDEKRIQPEGLKASAMTESQRAMLLDVVSEWSGLAQDGFATARMSEIKSGLDETWFAWSGPTTVEEAKTAATYFRIQGPKLVIEYAPQKFGTDYSMHIHTMYRDPTNDYGRALTAK